MREWMTVFAALGALAGCGGGGDGATTPRDGGGSDSRSPIIDSGSPGIADTGTGRPDSGGPPPGGTTPPPGAAERLVGTHAMQTRFASIQTLPFLGDQRSVTRAYALVTIAESGGVLTFTERGCHAEIEGGGTTMTTIPDAIPRSVPPSTATLEFFEMGGEWQWRRPRVETAVGFRPAGPGDAIPTMASDPRVFDQDGDGNPGVTVQVRGFASGDVYVVQWQRAWYQGPLGTSGEVTGENHSDDGEQQTIGASNMLLDMDIPTRPDPDRSDDTVRLVRLTGEYDCDRVVAEAGSLFP